jgi:prepilin-type N-terminal cleavage/methylation domain-containing protein
MRKYKIHSFIKNAVRKGVILMNFDRKGFTLIEVIVVVGIIAILAGILVPFIIKEIDEAKVTKAKADVKSIATAIAILKKDTGYWPVTPDCTSTVTILKGSGGVMPAFAVVANWDTSESNTFENYLQVDDNGCWPVTWRGPYMKQVSADPWGHSYIANATEFLSTEAVWILSAGPNGTVETGRGAMALSGDDIGISVQ